MKYYYHYNQGGNTSSNYPMQRSERGNCIGAFLNAFVTVAVGTLTFLVVYYGWVLLVRPLLHEWSSFLLVLGGK